MTSLNLVVIRAADLDVAERFYRALGLTFTRHRHGAGPEHLSAELGSCVFEIYPLGHDDPPTTGARIGFAVEALDGVLAAAVEAGGRMVSAPKSSPWGRRAVLADPFGHRVELIEKP